MPDPSSSSPRPVTIALAGNPNSGKTTIFNRLTGGRGHEGNYPGVTVESLEGWLRGGDGRPVRVVDLPGTYSLTAYTPEELVARDFLIDERPDAVVNVVDAANLERNLYLTTQLMELGLPLIVVFNMSDVADARGYVMDLKLLSSLLGVTVVRTVGHRGAGLEDLRAAIAATVIAPEPSKPRPIHYGEELERELDDLARMLDDQTDLPETVSSRWLALKLLEDDEEVSRTLSAKLPEPLQILQRREEAAARLQRDYGDGPEILIADHRYGFISGACQEAVKNTVELRHNFSDRIDGVVTNSVLGVPIFLALMYGVFKLTFSVGAIPMRWIEQLFAWVGTLASGWWPAGSDSALRSLVVDGLIGGVGGVLVFLPNILFLFLAIAVLEDSGYMARAAFIMDGLMHRIGLHGRSFIPMVIGFGCTVPAILATRTLESRRDRLTTMLVLPLMSCGARLPIYALLIPAFFPAHWQAPVLWLIYFIGIVLAIGLVKVLRSTVLQGEVTPFVMELPPYRTPTLKGLLVHVTQPAWMFLRKAGTVVLGLSILMWALTNYPKAPPEQLAGLDAAAAQRAALTYSAAGRIGHALEPVTQAAGFDWRINTALLGALAAKEVFVAQLGIVHSLRDSAAETEPLRKILQRDYQPLQAFCIMLFCLVGAPCIMTVAATWRESGSWRWAALQFGSLTALGFALAVLTFQIGRLCGLDG